MNNRNYSTLQKFSASLPSMFGMIELEYKKLMNVFCYIGLNISGFPELREFEKNSNKLTCIKVLTYMYSSLNHLEGFPLIMHMSGSIKSDGCGGFLVYDIINKTYMICNNTFQSFFKMTDDLSDTDLYCFEMSEKRKQNLQIIGKISDEILIAYINKLQKQYDIPYSNIVCIYNAASNTRLYGLVKYFTIPEMYFKILVSINDGLTLVYTKRELMTDDWVVFDIEQEYIPQQVMDIFKHNNFIIDDKNHCAGMNFVRPEMYPDLIGIAKENCVIIGKLEVINNDKYINNAISIQYGTNAVNILNNPILILPDDIHFVPTEGQKKSWEKFMKPETTKSNDRTFDAKIYDLQSMTYVKYYNEVYRVTEITDTGVKLTNFCNKYRVNINNSMISPVTEYEIRDMLIKAIPESQHLPYDVIDFKYDINEDVLYMLISLVSGTILKTPIYEDGEFFIDEYKKPIPLEEMPNSRMIIHQSKSIRIFTKDNKYAINIQPLSNDKNVVVTREGTEIRMHNYVEGELKDWVELDTFLIECPAERYEKFDLDHLYVTKADGRKLSILIPVTEKIAYCIIDLNTIRIVNIDDTEAYPFIYKFIGRVKERHDM